MAMQTSGTVTIHGITYTLGGSSTNFAITGYGANASATGRASADGTGATAVSLGNTSQSDIASTYPNYIFKYYYSGAAYPIAVYHKNNYLLGWYPESVLPYATYTVTYNANGGSGAPSNQTKVYGTALTLDSTKPTRTGYTFAGWNTNSSGTGTNYSAGGSYTANAAVTLYAKWTAITYTVSFNANGGSGAPSAQTKTYGVTLTLSSTTPTRTGYTFSGWATSSSATSATYAAGGSYTANAAVTLYAVWKVITYTVSYNANGGSGAPSSQTKTYGVTLTLSSTKPTRTGYTFSGWNTNSSGTGTNYSAGGSYTANAAVTLYAKWTAITYTVSYNANGGSGAPSAQTKTYGVTLTLSSTKPTRSGYAFKGWATSSSGSVAYSAGGSYTANAAVTLYAVWEAQKSDITSASNTTIGNAPSIKWTPTDSALRYKIKYAIGSWSYTTGYISPGSTSAYTYSSYSLPMAVCDQLPNSTTGTMTITLTTYTGDTALGSSSKMITVTVPSSVVPSISSVTVSEGTTSGFNVYTQSLSTVKAVITTAGSYSSIVKSATMAITGENSVSGNVSSNSCTLTSAVLKTYGSKTITITITDSRNRTASTTRTITVYEYFNPSVEIDVDVSGTDITINVTGKIASVNNLNEKTISITRQKMSTGDYFVVLASTTLDDYNYTKTISQIISDVDTESYQYTVKINDTKKTVTASKATGIVTLSLLAGGNGVAIGKSADTSDIFDINLTTFLRDKNLYITNGSTQKYLGIRGNNTGRLLVLYNTNGDHGLWSSGYGTSISDPDAYTEDNAWMIYRSKDTGKIFIPKWGGIGNYKQPVYFTSGGQPATITNIQADYITNLNNPSTGGASSNNVFYVMPYVAASALGTGTSLENYCKAYCKWICANYSGKTHCVWSGRVNHASAGIMTIEIYNTSNVDSDGYPQYCSGSYFTYDNNIILFGFRNYVWQFYALSGVNLASVSNSPMTRGTNQTYLWGGTSALNTEYSITNGYGNYSSYIVMYNVASVGNYIEFTVPKNFVGSSESNASYLILGAGNYYGSFKMYYSGTTLKFKLTAQTSTSAAVRYIYGLY